MIENMNWMNLMRWSRKIRPGAKQLMALPSTICFLITSSSAYASGPTGLVPVVIHPGQTTTPIHISGSNSLGSHVSAAVTHSLTNTSPSASVSTNGSTQQSTKHQSAQSNQAVTTIHSAAVTLVNTAHAATTTYAGTSQNTALPAAGYKLDLTSTTANIVLGSGIFSHGTSSVSINVGGTQSTFAAGQKVTAAEYVAIQEQLSTGAQTIVLTAQGTADGGKFALNSVVNSHVSDVVVPTGVTALDFAGKNGLTVNGDLSNFGSIYGISTNANITTASISASEITNKGTISTVLPAALLNSVSNAVTGLNLTLNSTNDISNSGAISSGGALTLASAHGAIVNTEGASVIAAKNINLSTGSGQLTNAGAVDSQSGNVNITGASHGVLPLQVAATGGTFQADSGNINVHSNSSIGMTGGNYLSNNLNLVAGSASAVTGNVGNVSGLVNISGGTAHFSANTNNLNLGVLDVAGDPLITSTGNLNVAANEVTAGNPLALVAEGNVTSNSGVVINTTSATGGGNLTVVAGANFTVAGGVATIVGPANPNGGEIDFATNPIAATSLDASSTGTGAGGNITLVAYDGLGINSGRIVLPTTITLKTGGGGGAASGNVTVIAADRNAAATNSIVMGGVNTYDGTGAAGTGNVTIAAANLTQTGPVVISNTGAITSGGFTAGATLPRGVQVGAITANGANISLQAGTTANSPANALQVAGSIQDNVATGTAPGGTVTIAVASANTFQIGQAGTLNGVQGNINVAGLGGAAGGTINVSNIGTGGIQVVAPTTNLISGGATNTGGTVILNSGTTGNLTLGTGNINVNGGAGGLSGGTINLTGSNIAVTGGALNLQASGANGTGGAGGTITVNALNPTSNLVVGAGTGDISANVIGGGSSAAGKVSISAANNLTVAATSLTTTSGTNANGGEIDLTAGANGAGNLQITGDLSVAGNGTGNGGKIDLSSDSATAFNIGGAGANSISGNSVASGAAGGTIEYFNTGTGGITVTSAASIQPTATNGVGGTIVINGGANGTVTFPNASTLNAPGAGNGAGGSITVKGSTVSLPGGVTLNAAGAGTGSGGTVNVTATSAASTLTVGAGSGTANTIDINAPAGLTGGNGGTAIVSAGGNLTVNPIGLNVNATGNGQGGNLLLTAGSAGTGNLSVTGSLAENGAGTGNGGEISLTSASTTTFSVNATSVNSIQGTVSATGSFGGVIIITNDGTTASNGGITIANASNIDDAAINGNGGTTELIAATNARMGVVTNSNGVVAINAVSPINNNGAGLTGAGGTIDITASSLNVTGGNLALNANGSAAGTGAGGQINVFTTSTTSSLAVDALAGDISVSATAGTNGGNGGAASIVAGNNLTVNTGSLNVAPQIAGTGGTLDLEAGAAAGGTGNLAINNSLDVSGLGTGSGGSVTLVSNSATTFDVNQGVQTNGINGTVFANAATNGNGGTVSITNKGAGGVSLSATTDVAATAAGNGSGGTIMLDGGGGTLTIPVTVAAHTLSVNGQGTGVENGGTIVLTANAIAVTGPSFLQLNAAGSDTGSGGTVRLIQTGTAGLTIGNANGDIAVNAQSGANGGGGGTVDIENQGLLTINGTQLLSGPLNATNGNGANITLDAGNVGCNGNPGNLVFTGNLTANAAANGMGGTININVNSTTVFNIATASGNSVSGVISADGGTTSGNGGTILIKNWNDGGITMASPNDVLVTAAGGSGGTIDINAAACPIDPGALTIPAGTLSANAGTGSGGSGGIINLEGTLVTISGGALTVTANGDGAGAGGAAHITTVNATTGDVTIGTAASNVSITANGGATGAGGSITIDSAHSIIAQATALSVTAGTNANGGTLQLNVGEGGSGGLLQVTGDLLAQSGTGNGNGGTVGISFPQTGSTGALLLGAAGAANQSYVTGTISADAEGLGTGGTVTISNTSTGSGNGLNISLGANAVISANSSQGTLGQVNFLTQAGQNINVAPAAAGDGLINGFINAVAQNVNIKADAANETMYVGTIQGTNGNVILTATNSGGNIVVGEGLEVTATGDVTLNTPQVTVFGLVQSTATAGVVTIQAPTGSNLTVLGEGTLQTTGTGANLIQLIAPTGQTLNVNSNITYDANNAASTVLFEAIPTTGTVNFGAATTTTIAHGATTEIVAGTTVNVAAGAAINGSGAIDVTTPLMNNLGAIKGAANILVDGPSATNLTLTGNGSYVSTGTAANITFATDSTTSNLTLAVNGIPTVNAGATGATNFEAQGTGGTISVGTGFGITDTGSLSLNLQAPNLTLADTALVHATNVRTAININEGTVVTGLLTITAPSSGTATVQTAGGAINVSNTVSGQSISYADSGANPAALAFVGGVVTSTTTNGNQTVQANTNITADHAITFDVNNGTFNVLGSVHATADPNFPGSGGTLDILSNTAGGTLTVPNLANLSVDPLVNGNGGRIEICNMSATGILDIVDGTVNANGVGPTGNGGTVDICGGTINVTAGASPLIANANGSGTGNGGTVTIQTLGNTGDINVGAGSAQVQLNAQGGATSGNGGTVNVLAARNVTIASGGSTINVNPAGANGNGGTVNITSGMVVDGTVTLQVAVNANGAGTGTGGVIDVTSHSATALTSNQTLSAVSGASAGAGVGGSITVQNDGFGNANGGVNVSSSINANGVGGGGSVTIQAVGNGNGPVTIGSTSITANGTGTGADNGGTITVDGSSISLNPSGTLTLSANGGGTGNGGTINLTTTGAGASITPGAGTLVLTATSGTSGGNGGGVFANAGGNIIFPSGVGSIIDVNSIGANGNGGTVSLKAGNSGNGIVQVSSGITADGVGTGNGGSVTVFYNDPNALLIGATGSHSFVSGAIHADAPGSGAGGSVTIGDLANPLIVTTSTDITATSLGGGALGNIDFLGGTAGTQSIAVSGTGNLTGIVGADGTTVSIGTTAANTTLTAGVITGTTGSVTLSVNTSDNSKITTVATSNIQAIGATSDLTLTGTTSTIVAGATAQAGRDVLINGQGLTDNGSITAQRNVTVTATSTAAPYTATLGANSTITATTGNIVFNDVNGGISITSGNGTLSADAAGTTGLVTFNGGTAAVNVDAATIVGCAGGTGSPFNLQTTSANQLSFGNITSAGSITVQSAGAAQLCGNSTAGSGVATAQTVEVTAAGAITEMGPLNNSVLTATNAGSTVTVSSTNGSVGTQAAPILINAPGVTLAAAAANQNVYASDSSTGTVTIGKNGAIVNSAGATYSFNLTGATGTIATAGGGNGSITTASGGTILLGAPTATTVTAGDTVGGTNTSSIGFETPLVTNNGTIKTGTGGNLAVDNSSGSLSFAGNGSWIAGNGMSASATGNVHLGGLFNSTTAVNLNGASFLAAAGGNIDTAGGTGAATIGTNNAAGSGGQISLIAGAAYTYSPAIPTSLKVTAPSAAGGSIDLTSGSTLSLNSSGGANGNGGNVTVVAFANTGTGTIKMAAGSTVNADGNGTGTNGNVTIIAGSTAGGTPVQVGAIAATGGSGGGGTVTLASETPVLPGTGITYTDAVPDGVFTATLLGANAGVISTQGNITAAGPLNITANGLTNPSILAGSSVNVTGEGGTGTIFVLNNSGSITANTTNGSVDVVSGTGQGLEIAGGGTLAVSTGGSGSVNLTATPTGTVANNIEFSGNQNFTGATNINAGNTNGTQAVIVDNGVTVTGANTTTLNTCDLVLIGTGTITGNPLIFDCPNGAGTIANSSGDVVLNGAFVFHGQSLALLSVDNIRVTGPSTIDLSNTGATPNNGNGGTLTAIAGFNFTPGTGGGQVGPNGIVYTIGTADTQGGNVDLSQATITTGSTTANGGDVAVIAHGGTTSTGTVTLGSINTTAAAGIAGGVTVIGQGGVTTNAITTTGATNGAVVIDSATPQTVGRVIDAGGEIIYGSFSPVAGSFNGNISVNGPIASGAAPVTLATGGTGGISETATGSIATTSLLTLLGGTGGIGSASTAFKTAVPNITANAGTTGSVYINSSTNVTFEGANGGQTFDVTANGNISTDPAATFAVHNISLISTPLAGTINLGSNTLTTTQDGTGNGGSINLQASAITYANSGTSPLTLNANATGTGNGGAVTITTTSNLALGTGNGQIAINATGGSTNSAAGNGGAATVTTTGAITLNAGGIVDGPLGTNGNGGSASLSGGTITLNTNINGDGVGTGSGGTISITAHSGTVLTDNQSLTADSGTSAGAGLGGTISVLNDGAAGANGGINVTNTLSASGQAGGGSITVAAIGTSGNPDGAVSVGSTSISANGTGTGAAAGGTVTIKGGTIALNGSGALTISANGGGTGNGGTIQIMTTQAGAAITPGGGTLDLSATSGAVGGNGGSVLVTAGGNVLFPSGVGAIVDVNAIGSSGVGNGGTVSLIAGNSGNGIIQVNSGITADGIGTGNGGNITVCYNDVNPIVIGSTGANSYVSGAIDADAPGTGAGGTVNICDLTHALTVTASAPITAGSAGGALGQINFMGGTAGTQAISVSSSANVTGIVNADGSTVSIGTTAANTTLTAGQIIGASGPVILSANTGDNSTIATLAGSKIQSVGAANDVTLTGAHTSIAATAQVLAGEDVLINGQSLTDNGTITAQRNVTITAASNAAPYTATLGAGSTITATTGNVVINNAGGGISMTSGSGAISADAGSGVVTFNGGAAAVNVDAATISGCAGGSGSPFSLQTTSTNLLSFGAITSGGSITVQSGGAAQLCGNSTAGVGSTAAASIKVTAVGDVTEMGPANNSVLSSTNPGSTITVSSSGGSVGTAAAPILIDGPGVTLSAGAAGKNVFASDSATGPVTVGNNGTITNTAGATYDLNLPNGSLVTAGAGNGNITTGAGGTILLFATGVTAAAGDTVGGANTQSIGFETPQVTNNGTIQTGTGGNLAVDNLTGNLSFAGTGTWTAGNGMTTSATGDVSLGGLFNSTTTVNLNGSNFLAAAGGNIDSTGGTGTGTIGTDKAAGTGGQISLIAGATYTYNPNLPPSLKVSGPSTNGGSIDLTTGSTIDLNSSSSGGGNAGNVTLVAFANGGTGGTIKLPATSTINAGTDTTGVNGNVTIIAGSAAGGNVLQVGAITASGGSGGGGAVTLASETPGLPVGGITYTDGLPNGVYTATLLGASAGTVSTLGAITAAGPLAVTANGLTNTAPINGSMVAVTGEGGTGSVFTLNNSGTIGANTTNGNVNIASGTGQGLLVLGGGTLSVQSGGAVNLTATPTGTVANNVEFSGNQTFVGLTNISASNTNGTQSVVVDDGVLVSGNTTVNLNTCSLILNGTGNITGAPLVFNCPNGIGTIANASGNVTLGSALVFHGQDLALLSVDNITVTAPITIDLSNTALSPSSGNGGTLTAIAGYNFTPLTGGVQVGPNGIVYTIGTPTGTGGNIDLSQATVNTSSTKANGGTVLVIAHGGTASTGSVVLGSINTSSSAAGGVGGSVTVIGQGGVTTNAITTTGATDGAISITSAAPQTVGRVIDAGGDLIYGSFSPVAGSFNGNISINGAIAAGAAPVSFVTGGTGSINQTVTGSIATTNTLVLTAGSGGIGTMGTPLALTVADLTANSGTAGNVYLTSAGDVTFKGANAGLVFNLTAGGNINTDAAATFNVHNLTFVSTPVAGVINFGNNTVATNQDASGNGGSIDLQASAVTFTGSGTSPLTLSANATGTGNGGSVTVTTTSGLTLGTGNGQFIVDATGGSAGSASGNGGRAIVTTTGTITLGTNPFNVGPLGKNGNGGSITLMASDITGAGNPIPVTVNGVGTGNGGTINITTTDASVTPTVGTGAGNFSLTANSGATSGNAGSITWNAAGGLNVNAAQLSANAIGSNGNGGTIFLHAGDTAAGNLKITGSLSANGVGSNGLGGTIDLQSNSSTIFFIGSATTNSVSGSLSTSAVNSANEGTIKVVNEGGSVINVVDITAVKELTIQAGGTAGSVIVGGSLVSLSGDIFLTAAGTGSITYNTAAESIYAGNSLTFTAPGGTIGSAATPLSTDTLITNINSAGSNTNLLNFRSGGEFLNTTTTPLGGPLNYLGTGVILVNSTSHNTLTDASTINIQSTTLAAGDVTGSISLGGSVISTGTGAAGTVSLQTTGANTILETLSGSKVTGTFVNLITNSGAIGFPGSGFSISGTSLSAPTTGFVYIYDFATAGVNVTQANSHNDFLLTSAGNLTINATGLGQVQALGLAAVANNGNITINQNVGYAGTVGGVSLLTTGSGSITGTGTVTGQPLSLTTGTGGNIFLNISTPSLAITGGGIVGLSNTSTNVLGLNSSTIAQSLALNSPGSITLYNVSTGNGNLFVVAGGSILQVVSNAAISATNGSITLENSNTTSGTIFINGGDFIHTSGATGVFPVNIVIGTTPTNPVTGTKPGNVMVHNLSSGSAFYGTNSVYVPNAPVTLNLAGSNIVFNTGTLPATAITIGTNVTITADPLVPTAASTSALNSINLAPAAAILNNVTFAGGQISGDSIVNVNQAAQSAANVHATIDTAPTLSVNAGLVSAVSAPIISALTGASPALTTASTSAPTTNGNAGNAALSSTNNNANAVSSLASVLNSIKPLEGSWISDTEMATGKIPAMLFSEEELGVTQDVSTVVELNEEEQAAPAPVSAMTVKPGQPLVGSVVRTANGARVMNLTRGSVVFAPSRETIVKTPFGDVKIAAKSVVLLMSFSHGLAIFDVDDSHLRSVTVKAGNHEMVLSPGMHAVVTSEGTDKFEQVNPAQLIGHRNMRERALGAGLKAFVSEFSIAQALQTVTPLKQLVNSKHVHAQKLTGRMLKTAAILQQMNAGNYEQVLRAVPTAYQAPVSDASPFSGK